MADTAPSISSSFSSSSSLSSVRSLKTRPCSTLPRRGQVKAAIFASIFTSILRLLGAQSPAKEGENGARSSHSGSGSHSDARISDFRIDAGDEGFSVENSRQSSPRAHAPTSSLGLLSFARPSSLVGGMQQISG